MSNPLTSLCGVISLLYVFLVRANFHLLAKEDTLFLLQSINAKGLNVDKYRPNLALSKTYTKEFLTPQRACNRLPCIFWKLILNKGKSFPNSSHLFWTCTQWHNTLSGQVFQHPSIFKNKISGLGKLLIIILNELRNSCTPCCKKRSFT